MQKGKSEKLKGQQSCQQKATLQNSQPKKKKNKNVALINSLPKNLEEECNRFFESNCT